MGFIIKVWQTADKPFLLLSAIATVMSHYIRAVRWKLLMAPLGHPLKTTHSFISVMIGYFVNLAIPRGGEISRCYNLSKLNKTPINLAFGTVVSERVVDLFFLLSLIAIAFFIELKNLTYFFSQLNLDWNQYGNFVSLWWLLIILIVTLIAIWWLVKRLLSYKFRRILVKLRDLLKGLKKGILIIFNLQHKFLFLAYSLGIWIMYFLMSYFIILAFPETHHLGIMESLTIFAIGGIAMAIPLPGGTGSYHVLVPLGLYILYGIAQQEAIAFSFIFHGFQTILVIFLGIISMFVSQWYIRRNKNEHRGQNS